MMFLDCPAYMDRHGTARCGLPAEVEDWYTTRSSDGPLESAKIRCPRGHWFNGPLDSLTLASPRAQASPQAQAGSQAQAAPPDRGSIWPGAHVAARGTAGHGHQPATVRRRSATGLNPGSQGRGGGGSLER